MSIQNLISMGFSWGTLILLISWLFVHVGLALGLFGDAAQRLDRGEDVRFLWPSGWALTGLVFGLFGAVAYWLMHHSSLDGAALRHHLDATDHKVKVEMKEPERKTRTPSRKPLVSSRKS